MSSVLQIFSCPVCSNHPFFLEDGGWQFYGMCDENSGHICCPHGSPRFPTWHQLMMKSFESTVFSLLSDQYPQYERELELLGVPYWDWTADEVPELITVDEVCFDKQELPQVMLMFHDVLWFVCCVPRHGLLFPRRTHCIGVLRRDSVWFFLLEHNATVNYRRRVCPALFRSPL